MAPALLLLAASLAADPVPPAPAAAPSSRWSLAGGETVAPGRDVFSAEVGWPSTTFGWTHGLTDYTDAGVRFDVLYAFETTTTTHFGLGLRVPLRAIALRKDNVSLQVHFDPGFKVYPGDGTPWGFGIPAGGAVGIQVSRELRLAVGVEVPMSILFSPAQFVVGTQFGLGADYFVDRQLLVSLNTRFGPVFSSSGGGGQFGFVTQVGVGYKM